MNLAWDDLNVLRATVRTGSLSAAARQLGVGQSTASRRIARLEERVGGALFERLPEGLKPTALASSLLPHADLIGEQMQAIARVAAGQEARPTGRVKLAILDGLLPYLLAPELGDFMRRYPGLTLDFLAGHAIVDLVRGEADLAIRFVRPTAADLVVKRLMTLELGAFASPEIASLPADKRPWVGFVDPTARFQETAWMDAHATHNPRVGVSSWADLMALTRAGVGAALLSPLVATSPLVRLDVPPIPSRTLYLVYHQDLRHVPRLMAVRDWITARVATFVRDSAD